MEVLSYYLGDDIICGTTLRSGGVSTEQKFSLNLGINVEDKLENVIENRKRLAQYLNISIDQMIAPSQTHTINVKKVTLADSGKGMTEPSLDLADVDGLYTRDKNLCLLTFHADCIPVLLYEKKQQLIAAIHAGWKGNVNGIVLHTIQMLCEKENCDPQNFVCIIGPSLGYANFEAKDDIISKVKQLPFSTKFYYYQKAKGNYLLDAKGLIKEQLLYCGVTLDNIHISPLCTKAHPDMFYSYRNNHHCGRHASFIMIKSS